MKKTLALLLALIMVVSIVLTACGGNNETPTEEPSESSSESSTTGNNDNNDSTEDDGNNSGGNTSGGNTSGGNTSGGNTSGDDTATKDPTPVVADKPTTITTTGYTLQHQFLSGSVRTQVETYMSTANTWATEGDGGNVQSYVGGVAPFIMKDDLGIGGSKLTSITLPVKQTGEADANGNFIFTIYKYKKATFPTGYGTGAAPTDEYNIKINGAQYGLSANSNGIYKVIDVDLRSYGIEIAADETIGVFRNGDTLFPLFLKNTSELKTYIRNQNTPLSTFCANVGKSNVNESGTNTLVLDFTYEKAYSSDAAYKTAVTSEFNKNGGAFKVNYLSQTDHAKIIELLDAEKSATGTKAPGYWLGGAPYAPSKDVGLTNCRLTSISIPVYSVNDNQYDTHDNLYTFTISVYNKSSLGVKNATPVITKRILVDGAAYGLTEGVDGLYKFIDVDISAYDIVVGADQILAFSDGSDVNGEYRDELRAVYVSGDAQAATKTFVSSHSMLKNWNCFAMNVGKDDAASTWNATGNYLLFDFTYERTFTSVDDYLANDDVCTTTTTTTGFPNFDEKLAAVQEAYNGLNLSILGDSISTYVDISFDTAAINTYNSTLPSRAENPTAIWYDNTSGWNKIAEAGFSSHLDTYWGRFLDQCNMKLCVDNAWSGSSFGGSGNIYDRVENLHNDHNGTKPDVILTYFGINNTWGIEGRDNGDLMVLLEERGDKTKAEVIAEWLDGFDHIDYTGSNAPATFDKCYAYMLYKMTEIYPDAQIVCMSLATNSHANYSSCVNRVPQYNEIIKELCLYFGCIYVDQTDVMSAENAATYTIDGIHPNIAGHELMFQAAVNAIYADLQAKKK